jgi:putative hydroxymethylpyrimidine transport system substrate-binding protein
MKWLGVLLATAVLALLVGCGGDEADEAATGSSADTTTAASEQSPPKKKLRLIEITIDGYPNADYAGLFLAQERGYFEDAGLEVSIHTPIIPKRPVPYVLEEAVELGVSHEPEVVLARERGAPIVAVGALLPHPTTSIVWLENSGIRGVEDLEGKTIGTEGVPYQKRFLEVLLAKANLSLEDVKVLKVGYSLTSALKNGRVDAIIGGSWNVEGLQLQAEGPKPTVVPVADLGFPRYDELVLVARQDRLPKNGTKIRDFMKVWARGNRAATEDPEAAVELLSKENAVLSRQVIAEGVEVTLPLLSKTFRLDPPQWRRFADWMHAEGISERPPPVSQLLTNAYIP